MGGRFNTSRSKIDNNNNHNVVLFLNKVSKEIDDDDGDFLLNATFFQLKQHKIRN